MGTRGGGSLQERFGFEKRAETPDGYGNTRGEWEGQFERQTRLRFLRGTEKVLQAAATSVRHAVISVRACTATRQIAADWRAVDRRSGEVWNIHAVEPQPDRLYIDLIVSTGGADG